MFPRNHWYVAAWDDEVDRHLLARTFLGENVVLFRREDGTPVALEDRCAHRRLPLSMGRLIGDDLQCGYHGLVYDCAGACIKIPGQDRIAPGARVRSYPCIERDRFVYVWMGDPALADPDRIVSFPRLSDAGWGLTRIRLHVKANYLLIVDNLLDLSHVAYLHGTTIGNAPVAEEAEVLTERRGRRVRITREMINVPAARTYAEFGAHKGACDRWQLSEFIPPSYFFINNGSAAAGSRRSPGRLEGPGEWGFQVYHGITPETERSTHQFWVVAHERSAVPAAGLAEFYRQCHQVIGEDLGVYEAQQRSLDGDPRGASAADPRSTAVLAVDRGLGQARRIIAAMLRAERQGTRAGSGNAARRAASGGTRRAKAAGRDRRSETGAVP